MIKYCYGVLNFIRYLLVRDFRFKIIYFFQINEKFIEFYLVGNRKRFLKFYYGKYLRKIRKSKKRRLFLKFFFKD